MTVDREQRREVIGLIPAGGQAMRIASLPCSKELYPVGFSFLTSEQEMRPKVVGHYLIEKMRLAGIKKMFIVLREGKWDIPAYFRDGAAFDVHLAYLIMNLPFGTPYTLDQAYPFVQDALISLGFPDILFSPEDAFIQLLARQSSSKADVVLGLFPADQPRKVDLVDSSADGKVNQIVIKPRQTQLSHTWGIAVWTPVFTHFMHEYLATARKFAPHKPELFVGDIVQAAIRDGLRVEAVYVSDEPFLDIGTPDDLIRAVRLSVPGQNSH
jgi:glucose-1-phosphate thymidylyltransferase